ncbi:hypothetical protein [uncultured Nostoc sp.]|uniref:hypothetical protein n=1 Tax=uncultured Nostoc sp. TaxID=340711 RepID=UPI0035CA9EC8
MNNKLLKLEYIRQNQDALYETLRERGLATATLSVRDSDSTLIVLQQTLNLGWCFTVYSAFD